MAIHPQIEELPPMGEVELSSPRWGTDLSSHFGRADVATRFANYGKVSRTDGWLRCSTSRVTPSVETSPHLRVPPLVKYP